MDWECLHIWQLIDCDLVTDTEECIICGAHRNRPCQFEDDVDG